MKLWLKIGLFLVLGIPLVAFTAYWVYEFADRHNQQEQYAVYSAWLSQGLQTNYHDFGNGHGLLLILDHSVKPMAVGGEDEVPQASSQMRRDLLLHSLRTIHFERKFILPTEYRLVSSEELLADKNGFVALPPEDKRRSLGAYITFSRIGFDRTGTLALFYTEHLACGLCGGGDLVLMQKQTGQWKVIGDYSPWVS